MTSPVLIDARGPRFSAGMTAVVTGTALVFQGPVGVGLVALQAAVFAIATVRGVVHSPWAWAFRIVRARRGWGPPTELEDARPPRFSQLCGLVVLVVALGFFVGGLPAIGWVAVGLVLALSTTLAVSGVCLGCELYLLGARVRSVGRRPA